MIHYFDNCATTRMDDEIARITAEYATVNYFNPSARSTFSLNVANDLNSARLSIAKCLGVNDKELFFTSGGTESDNLAVFGSLRTKKGNIVVTAIEHSAVYNAVMELSNRGYEVRLANVTSDGHIDADDFVGKIDENTLLACFMHVSNETGAVNDIKTLNARIKSVNRKTVTFSDGVQAVGKIPVNLRNLGVDLYSFAGHKIHASKGIGCLYVKTGTRLNPVVFGGGQERGMRSGTEYVGGVIGLGRAIELAVANLEGNAANYCVYKQIIVRYRKVARKLH